MYNILDVRNYSSIINLGSPGSNISPIDNWLVYYSNQTGWTIEEKEPEFTQLKIWNVNKHDKITE